MINSAKCIITEFYEFASTPELIIEAESKGQPIVMSGILQKAGTLNRNGRVYPFDILKREADKYMESVENNTATGELDHPDSAVVSLANVSHKVTDMWWNGEELHGKIQITETPAGNILKGLLKSGVMLGISSRGVGSVKSQRGNDVVQDDFELIAFDFVSSPSTPGAYLFKEGKEYGLSNGMIPLSEDNAKILKLNNQNYKEQLEKYSQLYELYNSEFWKKQ